MIKRCVDVALSAVALLLLSPVLGVVALAVWLDSGSPILFRQERVGVKFRRFQVLKFRSMRVHAGGLSVTVAGDERVTRVGKFLRVTKLDEVLQFWNVLRGDMSLVGPRPEVPQYVELYRSRYQHILTVRPGITDPASVQFRHEERILAESGNPAAHYAHVILPAKLNLADQYVRTRSFWGDALLLWKTFVATVRLS